MSSKLAAWLVAVGAAAAGCARPATGSSCKGGFVAGDLVITEIMANPSGDDAGQEWFEIYNEGSTPVDLAGLVLIASKSDGTGEKTHTMTSYTLAGKDFLAVGSSTAEPTPDHIGYSYGSSLGNLRNDMGRLALRCGSILVDEVTYIPAVPDGAARSFGGEVAPDALANDSADAWCTSKIDYDGKNFGTPGEANESCKSVAANTCLDNGATRDVVPPAAGDLIVTEVMADPSKVSDTTGEWFEVAVLRTVDINGLQLGTKAGSWKSTVSSTNCLSAKAGTFLVFARAATGNGGLPTPTGLFNFDLANGGGTVAIGFGGQTLDEAAFGASTAGTALQLDATKMDAADNDAAATFCKATASYGDGDKGTPGAENALCGTVIGPGPKCLDGGAMREIVKPKAGELIITELLPDPDKVSDAMGEWFEVLATADIDLNGLQLGTNATTIKTTITDTNCLRVAAGSYAVLAANPSMAANGGVTALAGYDQSKLGLINSGGGLALLIDNMLLDAISYGAAQKGVALSLSASKLNIQDNDISANFCAATKPFGAGDRGTPGETNPPCP